MKYIIRFTRPLFKVMVDSLKAAGRNESQVFVGFKPIQGANSIIFLANTLVLPDKKDLSHQSPVAVEPTREFQTIAYGLAQDQDLIVGDVHTHPFSSIPHFSSIDDHHGKKNARYLATCFEHDSALLMIVFGRDLRSFEARVWNRKTSTFENIDEIEVLGTPTHLLSNTRQTQPTQEAEFYARHDLIPGWEQGRLENLRVLVIGLGGNGSLVWESLVSLGIGNHQGWLKACDPDHLEASNVSRIPYANADDVGASKAELALRYAHKKSTSSNTACYQVGIEDEEILKVATEAHVIIICVDGDGPRKTVNSLAVRSGIPLVDVSTEIIPNDSSFEAAGQVQAVLPGETGCLVCSGKIDPSTAAIDQMSKEDEEDYARVGYVRGTDETPTPSVIHLNGIASHLGISQFLRIVFDEEVKGREFLHYDRQGCQLVAASAPCDPKCPVCGKHGYLLAGAVDPDSDCRVLEELNDLVVKRTQ